MHKILSVDDEPINQVIVEELFSSQFEVALLSSGEECLSQIKHIKPALILLDVSMPGIDGYQTCSTLKADESTRHIPIVFVSARSTLEDKIKGYVAGGQDYITKPFNHSELGLKIEQLIKSASKTLTDMAQENHLSPVLASSKPLFSTDSDTITHFFDISLNCYSVEELGKILLNTCEQLHLNCVIQFRSADSKFNFSSISEASPLELSLIEQTQEQGRFFAFNSQLIVTFSHLSLLAKNMPKDNDRSYSDLKILLAVLLSAVESKLKALFNETKTT